RHPLDPVEPALVCADRSPRHRAMGRAQPQPGGAAARPRAGRQPEPALPALAGPRLRGPAPGVRGRACRGADQRGAARDRHDAGHDLLPHAHRRADEGARIVVPLRAVVVFLPGALAMSLDGFRRTHDPRGARAIDAHVTVVHRSTPEIEARLPAARGNAPFRLSLGEVVELGAESGGYGAALSVLDTERGLERLCGALAVPMSTLPHITLLHPRNSSGREAQIAALDAAKRLTLPRDFMVDEITLIEERHDAWHAIQRIPLGR